MGQQAYVVAPAIDAGETALTSATGEAEYIARDVFPDLKVAVLHGRMPPKEKDAVMAGFKRGEIDVLVATTVVEVGVDVPNASVMVILDADRYGLATLHQLRGRVGRGAAVSSCILMTSDDKESIERLDVLAQTNDGFEIAEADLRLRKAGQLAGTSQAGEPMGTIGDIIGDFALYMKAKGAAEAIVSVDPELVAPENAALRGLIDDVAAARALLVTA
jgi:ATP-dependent DNA helicase RecG